MTRVTQTHTLSFYLRGLTNQYDVSKEKLIKFPAAWMNKPNDSSNQNSQKLRRLEMAIQISK